MRGQKDWPGRCIVKDRRNLGIENLLGGNGSARELQPTAVYSALAMGRPGDFAAKARLSYCIRSLAIGFFDGNAGAIVGGAVL